MNAYLEVTGGIIRSGAACQKWLDPFEYAVAVVGDGPLCVLKALVAGDQDTMMPYLRAAYPALRAAGFKRVRFDHRGHPVEIDL